MNSTSCGPLPSARTTPAPAAENHARPEPRDRLKRHPLGRGAAPRNRVGRERAGVRRMGPAGLRWQTARQPQGRHFSRVDRDAARHWLHGRLAAALRRRLWRSHDAPPALRAGRPRTPPNHLAGTHPRAAFRPLESPPLERPRRDRLVEQRGLDLRPPEAAGEAHHGPDLGRPEPVRNHPDSGVHGTRRPGAPD